MKFRKNAIAAVIGFALMLPAGLSFANPGAPKQFNKQMQQLSTQWWEFVLSIPSDENPTSDSTGAKCVVGQDGPVWFLVGTAGAETVTRNCSVPASKALFFPIVDNVNVNAPNVCGQGPANVSVKDLQAANTAFIDGVTNAGAEVDGQPVKKLSRVSSEVFAAALPEDNYFDSPCMGAGLGNVPAGIYSPAVADGLYVLLKPLAAGSHTLHFHADNPSQGFSLDVTYHLNVVAVL